MQARPPPAERYIPPTPPAVPINAVQSLIPRLSTAINDIDSLKAQIAAGNADGSMPSWDTLLQRYSMLLGRVQQLTAYISQASRTTPGMPAAGTAVRPPGVRPPPGAPGAIAAPGAPGSSKGPGTTTVTDTMPPALAHYLVHALNPLPADASPHAPDVLFQVINTVPLPQLSEAQDILLGEEIAGGSGGTDLLSRDGLSKLDEAALGRQTAELRARLQRESHRASGMAREIQRREDEYDWAMRVGDDAEEEEKDDLFDDDEDDGGDVQMKSEEPKVPNPREGWSVGDYLSFLDSGKVPTIPPPPASVAA